MTKAIIFSLIISSSCIGQQKTVSLQNTTYRVIRIKQDRIVKDHPTFQFKPDQKLFTGHTGCNAFSATLEGEDKVFHIGSLRITKKYCEEQMPVERNFLRSLKETSSYEIQKNLIYFRSQDGKLTFKAQKMDTHE